MLPMQNVFQFALMQSIPGAGWEMATFNVKGADPNLPIDIFLFSGYVPMSWEVTSIYGPFSTPFVSTLGNWTVTEPFPGDHLLVPADGILVVPTVSPLEFELNVTKGSTVTNGVEVYGSANRIYLYDHEILNVAGDTPDLWVKNRVICEGATVRGCVDHHAIGSAGYVSDMIAIPEADYTQAMRDHDNILSGAGYRYKVVALWGEAK